MPEADLSDPAWGLVEGDGYSVELSLGDKEELDSFAMHLRGDETALYLAWQILERLGLRAFSPESESGIFALDADAMAGFRRWQAFRDEALGKGGV